MPDDELPYVIDPKTGMAISRTLNTPGFVPPTVEESQAMIERANEGEDLCRAGYFVGTYVWIAFYFRGHLHHSVASDLTGAN